MLYREEYTHRFNLRPDPIERAFAAARRAVEAAPSNHLAHHALASAQFFRRELPAFRNSAERAIALNSMDGFTAAYLGFLIAYSGDWERGCALGAQAMRLNPHHPGWYWFVFFFDAYRKSDYRGALDIAHKINMPGFWRTQLALATAYAQLGEREAARNAVRELLALRPDDRRSHQCTNLASSLRNARALLAESSRLFERVRHLQDAEIFFVAADDLHAYRKSFRRETSRH